MREGTALNESSPEAPATVSPPVSYMTDAWAKGGRIPLDRFLERSEFHPLLVAFLALLLGLVLFQVVMAPIATALMLVKSGVPLGSLLSNLEQVIEEHAQALITANTLSLILGIAVPTLVLTWLHTSRPDAFLRLRSPNFVLMGLGVVGLFFLLPIVHWLGNLNSALPLPQAIRDFDQSQMDMIERVLGGDLGLWFSLIMLAVTPALCEEVFFRGYLQRLMERGLGIWGGIVASGLVFGLYHIRLTQVIPLSVLGIYLAFLAWRTGSLWVPIIVHFANNAFAVAFAVWAKTQPAQNQEMLEQIDVPWYFLVVGLLFFGLTLMAFQRHVRQVQPRLPLSPPPGPSYSTRKRLQQ